MPLKMAAVCLDASLEMLWLLFLSQYAPSPGGSLPMLSLGFFSDCPHCCDVFGKPCPPKQPTVYGLGG